MSKNYEEIEEDDFEDNEDCACALDFDDENDEYFDDDEVKPKKKKAPEKTVDDYLATLRKLFDGTEYEVMPYEVQPNMNGSKSTGRTFYRILCKSKADPKNKNPNIEYVNWVEFKIRNENDWPKKYLKYIIDNYQLLVKDEDMSFFAKEDPFESMDQRKGLNYYLFYKSRKLNPIPSFDEMMELRKATLKHIFQNGMYEENNPRIDSFDEYDFEGYSFKKYAKEFMENGATDIELVDVFGMRLHMGVPHLSCYHNGEEYQSYPYWFDDKGINDSGNNIEYFYEESIFNKEYIAWLRELTGWKTRSYGSFDDEIVTELIENLAHHHRIKEDEVVKLAKQSEDYILFQKALNSKYSSFNGGGGCSQYMCLFGHTHEQTKTGVEISLTARKTHLQHYGFWDSSTMTKNRHGDTYIVFEGNAYQKVWQHYYSKIKHIDLYSMFADVLIEPSNNTSTNTKQKAVQYSLF